MSTSNGLVRNEPVIVLRDTDCSRVIVESGKRRVVNREGWLCDVTVARTLLKVLLQMLKGARPILEEQRKLYV